MYKKSAFNQDAQVISSDIGSLTTADNVDEKKSNFLSSDLITAGGIAIASIAISNPIVMSIAVIGLVLYNIKGK